jgi:uncharacterized heparinase superfamily protein
LLSGRGTCPPDDRWPADFESCDAQARGLWPETADVSGGQFSVLGHYIDLRRDKALASALPQLVEYHVHYWDWAWALRDLPRAEAQTAFGELLASWEASTPFPQGDAWSPYVVSLRSWSWCCQFDSLIRGGPAEDVVRQLLWKQLGFVRCHLEKDVGGNHLIKNLKAWLALGLFFNSEKDVNSAARELGRQLPVQILLDGGHYEMAPAYHVQVLADLIDVRNLLSTANLPELLPNLGDVVLSMQRYLGAVVGPDGRVVLLNDGYPVHQDMLRVVQPQPWPGGSVLLRNSGLARLGWGKWTVFMDVGDPCPDDLPAHAHADTLGCLVFFGERRIIGEAFTSTYGSADRRSYERSTAGHSTVEVSGQNSTEVWGAFRAGRRARVGDVDFIDLGEGGASVSAGHDGYRHLPGSPRHYREVQVSDSGIVITDRVSSGKDTHFALRWHVPPNPEKRDGFTEWILDSAAKLSVESDYPARLDGALEALDFEQLAESSVIRIQGSGRGTMVVRTRITQHPEEL